MRWLAAATVAVTLMGWISWPAIPRQTRARRRRDRSRPPSSRRGARKTRNRGGRGAGFGV